jgi:[protein-PII] uridylyltransferase
VNAEPRRSELEAFLSFRNGLRELAPAQGYQISERLSDLADEALRQLSASSDEMALLAVGGYGRRELCLHSDLDVLLVHEGPAPDAAVRSILYPLWDAGLKVGHATRTVRATLAFARDDHNTLCSLLNARLISGPAAIRDELEMGLRRLLASLRNTFPERLAAEERAVWTREPFALQVVDVKNGRGALRSLHRLNWDRQRTALLGEEPAVPANPNEEGARRMLLAVRHALHAIRGKASDTFPIELRTAVGQWLGKDPLETATELYRAVRAVDGIAALRWGQVRPGGVDPIAHAGLAVMRLVRSRWTRRLPMSTPFAFATAATASQSGGRLTPWEHEFARRAAGPDWQAGDRAGLLSLLAAGESGWQAILGLWEAGWMTRALPEIAHLRGLAQAAPFHRHPVDAHLGATVVNLVELAEGGEGWLGETFEQLGSLDEALLAAFLHDIGKGLPGDHSKNGSRLARDLLTRLGFGLASVDLVAGAVQHHLLLTETAARRDIDDPVVVSHVAKVVGNSDLLCLLAVLSAADSRATSPELWTPWKESLVRTLFSRVGALLAGVPSTLETELMAELEAQLPAFEARAIRQHVEAMPAGYLARFGPALVAEHIRLTAAYDNNNDDLRTAVIPGAPVATLVVATRDRPALLATVAGVLSLRNLNVLEARAVTRSDGLAIDTFRVADALGSDMIGQGRWPAVREELTQALRGQIDLTARLAAKRAAYLAEPGGSPPQVRVSGRYIDVRASDRVGLLHDIAAALASLGLDVQLAKIDTRAGEAIDVFEIADPELHSPDRIREHLLRSLGW